MARCPRINLKYEQPGDKNREQEVILPMLTRPREKSNGARDELSRKANRDSIRITPENRAQVLFDLTPITHAPQVLPRATPCRLRDRE